MVGAVWGAWASQLAPGFAVDFADATARGPLWKEIKLRVLFGHRNWHHVPQVFRDDVYRKEIDFAGGIAAIISPTLHYIVGIDKTHGGFDLNAPKLAAGVEDEVVALAVSPDAGNAEAKIGGFGKKSCFGRLAARLTCGEADGMDFGNDG